jgi:hypothetical protein
LQISFSVSLPVYDQLKLSITVNHLQNLINIDFIIFLFSEIKWAIIRVLVFAELTFGLLVRHIVLDEYIIVLVGF